MEKIRRNPFLGIVKWFREMKSELKKVVWPSYSRVQQNTIIVLVCILVIGAFIWILDFAFGAGIAALIGR